MKHRHGILSMIACIVIRLKTTDSLVKLHIFSDQGISNTWSTKASWKRTLINVYWTSLKPFHQYIKSNPMWPKNKFFKKWVFIDIIVSIYCSQKNNFYHMFNDLIITHRLHFIIERENEISYLEKIILHCSWQM